jgi:uncharacterized protein (TIGR02300 family)
VSKAELGTRRVCTGCGAKFYDLFKDPIVCPKCQTALAKPGPKSRRPAEEPRPEPAKAAPVAVAAEAEEADEVATEADDKATEDEIEVDGPADDEVLIAPDEDE